MKTLEQGQSKIQKICDSLKKETLEPAKQLAANIIEEAKQKADEIVIQAKQHAHQIIEDAKKQIVQERNVFQSSLDSAERQSVEALKQTIENSFFNSQLDQILKEEMVKPNVVAKLIDAIVTSIEKNGFSADVSALIPKTLNPQEINALITDKVKEKLQKQSVEIGNFSGGVQVRLHDKKMMIDITEETLKELLFNYVRKDLRTTFFGK